jgi:Protein of unknown function (DUF667)
MFAEHFQSGLVGVEVLTPAGKNPPARLFKINGPPGLITKEYEREIKGFKYEVKGKGSQTSSIQCPSAAKDSLGLTQPLIVFQLRSAYQDDPMNLEIVVIDSNSQRRRLLFSTTFRTMELNSLHAQIPWTQPRRDIWTNVVFDLQQLTHQCYSSDFVSVDAFLIRPVCFLRKVFTLPLAAIQSSSGEGLGNIAVPSNFDFPLGAIFTTFQITAKKVPSKSCKDGASPIVLGTGLQVSGSKIQSQKTSSSSGVRRNSRSPVRSGSAVTGGRISSKQSGDSINESHAMMKSEMLLSAGVRSISAGANRAAAIAKLNTEPKAMRSKSLANINDKISRTPRTPEEDRIIDSQVDELSKLLSATLDARIDKERCEETASLVPEYLKIPEQSSTHSSSSARSASSTEKKVSYKDETELYEFSNTNSNTNINANINTNSGVDPISAKQLSHLITRTTSASTSNSRPGTGNRVTALNDLSQLSHLKCDDIVQHVRVSTPITTTNNESQSDSQRRDENISMNNVTQSQTSSEAGAEEYPRPFIPLPILHYHPTSIKSASQLLLLGQDEEGDGDDDGVIEARIKAGMFLKHDSVNEDREMKESSMKEMEELKEMECSEVDDEQYNADEAYDNDEVTVPLTTLSSTQRKPRANVYDRANMNTESTEISRQNRHVFLTGSMENVTNDYVLHGSLSRNSTSSTKSDIDDFKNDQDQDRLLDRTGRIKWKDEDNFLRFGSELSSPSIYMNNGSDIVLKDVLNKTLKVRRRLPSRESDRGSDKEGGEGYYQQEDDSTIDLLAQLSNGFESEVSSSSFYLSPNAITPVRSMNSIQRMTSPQASKHIKNLRNLKKTRSSELSSSSTSPSDQFSHQEDVREVHSLSSINQAALISAPSSARLAVTTRATAVTVAAASSRVTLETRRLPSQTDCVEAGQPIDEEEEAEEEGSESNSDSNSDSDSDSGGEFDEEDEVGDEDEEEDNIFSSSTSSPLLAVLTNQLHTVLSVLMQREHSFIEEFGEDCYTAIR